MWVAPAPWSVNGMGSVGAWVRGGRGFINFGVGQEIWVEIWHRCAVQKVLAWVNKNDVGKKKTR